MKRNKRANPFAEYAESVPSAIMRFIASVVVTRGLSQEQLARMIAERCQRSIRGANVRHHFYSDNPRASTVAMYASVLGLSDDVLRIKGGEGLTTKQLSESSDRLRSMLRMNDTDFEPGTGEMVLRYVEGLGDSARRQLLEAFVVACELGELPKGAVLSLSIPRGLIAVGAMIAPEIDLAARVYDTQPTESTLWSCHIALQSLDVFNDFEVKTFVRMMAMVLKAKGLDTTRMIEYYNRNRSALLAELKANRILK